MDGHEAPLAVCDERWRQTEDHLRGASDRARDFSDLRGKVIKLEGRIDNHGEETRKHRVILSGDYIEGTKGLVAEHAELKTMVEGLIQNHKDFDVKRWAVILIITQFILGVLQTVLCAAIVTHIH